MMATVVSCAPHSVMLLILDTAKAIWNPQDINKLLEMLKEERASAGNGSNFKKATFRKVVEELEKLREKGGPKTARVCESKWGKV